MDVVSALQSELNNTSPVSLYVRLTECLKAMIRSGEIAPGTLLPSEPLLCEKLQISRSTVRQSLALLESEGLVVRRRGKGTFVSKPKLERRLSHFCSFTNQMNELGLESATEVLEFRRCETAVLPELHGMRGQMYEIVRLRFSDGTPYMIDTAYIPQSHAPTMTAKDLVNASLYDVVEKQTGKTPYRAVETYEVVKLTEAQMTKLQTDNPTAFLVTRTSKTVTGEPFEAATMLIRGDRCRLEAQLESGAVAFTRAMQ